MERKCQSALKAKEEAEQRAESNLESLQEQFEAREQLYGESKKLKETIVCIICSFEF